MSCNNTKSCSSEFSVILSVMYHSNVSGRSSDLRALLIAAIGNSVSTNHVWRERKETTRVNFRRNAKRHTATDSIEQLENSVPNSHIRRERKETTRVNFGRNAKRYTTTLVKSCNSKQQIHRKHFYFKNKDNKHRNCKRMSYNNTRSMQISAGSSECTVISSVMYH
ncbi:hypothetical protein T08_16790, partial [Trichinella sp. T8]